MLSLLQRGTSQALLQAQTKQWLAAHDKRLPLPPLSPKVLAFIKEWYFLVDTDGSGELSLDEVAAAMKVIWLTCSTETESPFAKHALPDWPTSSNIWVCTAFIHSFVRSFIHSFIHPPTHSLIHSFVHLFIHYVSSLGVRCWGYTACLCKQCCNSICALQHIVRCNV